MKAYDILNDGVSKLLITVGLWVSVLTGGALCYTLVAILLLALIARIVFLSKGGQVLPAKTNKVLNIIDYTLVILWIVFLVMR
jgi:hypothetical protein